MEENKRVEVFRVAYHKPVVLLSGEDHAPFTMSCKGGLAMCLHCREA